MSASTAPPTRSSPAADSEADSELVADVAAVLQASGQSTATTLSAVQQLNRGLRTNFGLVPEWATLTLLDQRPAAAAPARIAVAPPTGVNIRAVALTMSAVDEVERGVAVRADLATALAAARQSRPANLWVFLLACASGSAALAVIFGAQDLTAVLLAGGSAVLGGAARRSLARVSVGPVAQVFAAAFLAGIIGGLAVRADLSSSLRLIAVCPAMVLVPGPHILNGTLDLLALRIPLGAARLGYALLLLLSIGTGLAIALSLFGTGLPADPPARSVPLAVDVIAAGVAAASYPVYFAMPYRLFIWPVAVGAAAHGLRWLAMSLGGLDIEVGAFIACLFVGGVLSPVAKTLHIPFAGVGFAAVVSLVPGVYVFRALDALGTLPSSGNDAQLLGAISDGATAALVIMAMAAGLIVPMRLHELIRSVAGR